MREVEIHKLQGFYTDIRVAVPGDYAMLGVTGEITMPCGFAPTEAELRKAMNAEAMGTRHLPNGWSNCGEVVRIIVGDQLLEHVRAHYRVVSTGGVFLVMRDGQSVGECHTTRRSAQAAIAYAASLELYYNN